MRIQTHERIINIMRVEPNRWWHYLDMVEKMGFWDRTFGLGGHYPALIRLEKSGQIESKLEIGPEPRRRIYRLVTS